MSFLIDTNVASELARPRPSPQVARWFIRQSIDSMYLSVVTIGEIRKGAELLSPSPRRDRLENWIQADLVHSFDGRILPVTLSIADQWGRCDAKRRLAGRPLSTADGLIAATAFEHDLTLVTRNVPDFDGLGVTIVNPWAE
jgi:toxin FitB